MNDTKHVFIRFFASLEERDQADALAKGRKVPEDEVMLGQTGTQRVDTADDLAHLWPVRPTAYFSEDGGRLRSLVAAWTHLEGSAKRLYDMYAF